MHISTAKKEVLQSIAGAFPGNAVLHNWRIISSPAYTLCGHGAPLLPRASANKAQLLLADISHKNSIGILCSSWHGVAWRRVLHCSIGFPRPSGISGCKIAKSPRICCRAAHTALCRYLSQNLHNSFAPFLARRRVEEGAPVGSCGLVISLDAKSLRICCRAALAMLCRYLPQN
jgi:hypothetical protein